MYGRRLVMQEHTSDAAGGGGAGTGAGAGQAGGQQAQLDLAGGAGAGAGTAGQSQAADPPDPFADPRVQAELRKREKAAREAAAAEARKTFEAEQAKAAERDNDRSLVETAQHIYDFVMVPFRAEPEEISNEERGD